MKPSIGIIGAGFTGLSAAYDLSQSGYQVTLYEASNAVGGLAAGIKEPDWKWSVERYYHHWFEGDDDIKQLITELGLSQHLIYPHPTTVAYFKGSFYPLDSVKNALNFPGFNLLNLLRFGVATIYLKYLASWRSLESVTAHKWLLKWYGSKVFEQLWQPLLEGKFGSYSSKVNMAWMWARLKVRSSKLGTFKGGFQSFINKLVDRLIEQGVTISTNAPVIKVTRSQSGKFILDTPSGQYRHDLVLNTTSPNIMTKLFPDLPHPYLEKLNHLKSLGAVVILFSLTKPLSLQKYYWYNLPKKAGFPMLALVEHTNFVSSKYFNNQHLVYCGDYRLPDHEYFKLSDKELVERCIPALKKINPNFNPSWITKTWVNKTTYAQPVPLTNHSINLPSITTPIKGLYYASMSHIYPWDRGTNYAVRLGRQVAQTMMT